MNSNSLDNFHMRFVKNMKNQEKKAKIKPKNNKVLIEILLMNCYLACFIRISYVIAMSFNK